MSGNNTLEVHNICVKILFFENCIFKYVGSMKIFHLSLLSAYDGTEYSYSSM